MAVAADDIFIGTQLIQAHGSPGVELLSGDTHFTAQAEFAAVCEAGGDIDINGGAVRFVLKAPGIFGIFRDDGLAVAGGVLQNMGDGGIYAVHHSHGQDIV